MASRKYLIVLIVALAALSGALSACGGSSDAKTQAEAPSTPAMKECFVKAGAKINEAYSERGGLVGEIYGITPHGVTFDVTRTAPSGAVKGGKVNYHLNMLLGRTPNAEDKQLMVLCTTGG